MLAAAASAWAVAALLPLAPALPGALATGAVVRHLHGELSLLTTGWDGYVESSGSGSSTFAWEWSYGPVSAMRIEPSWRELSIALEPVTCPGNRRQRIVFAARTARASRTLTLSPGFNWYHLPLGWTRGGRVLTLTYRCVVVPALLHDGDPDERPLAVAISGLAGTR